MRAALVVIALLLALPVQATELVPQSREQISMSFAPVAKQAAPAVVNIYAERVVRQRVSPLMNDPIFSQLFGDDFNFGVPRNRVEQSLGSGVIVQADGLIVTNRHVVKDAAEVKVILNDRREFPAQIVLIDDKTDLAVLRIDTAGLHLPVLRLADSDALEVGDLVLAIGNPFGVGQTVTSGIISATARTGTGITDYGYFIQTDAAINPGNSGGALVDMQGELIGINTAIYSRNGGSMGIGFAIPANMVRTVIEAGKSGQRPVRPWLGLSVQEVTADLAGSLGLERPQGVLVRAVHPASPLGLAGVKVGDIITAIDGQSIDNPEGLGFRTATKTVGGKASLSLIRKGSASAVEFALVAPPEQPKRNLTVIKGNNPFAGAEVGNLSPALADELGYQGSANEGVIITAIKRNTIAFRLGLKEQDVILEINRQSINTVEDIEAAVAGPQRSWRLKLLRGDQVISTVVGG